MEYKIYTYTKRKDTDEQLKRYDMLPSFIVVLPVAKCFAHKIETMERWIVKTF